jgi:outer membrane protein assembly factor BamB
MARFHGNAKAILAGCIFLIPLICVAGWPTINGNSLHNGYSGIGRGPDSINVMWSGGAAPAWFGGPIFIEGNRVFTMRFNGLNNTPIVCYDLQTGDELWRVNFTGHNSRALPIGAQDGKVYAVNFCETQHDTLYALSVVDGSVIWQSEQRVHIGITFSAVFASGGDLIIPGDNYRLMRINHLTGELMWSTPRVLPVVGGSEHLIVYAQKVYGWQGTLTTPKQLTAWSVSTGQELFHTDLPGDGDQEIPITCDANGTIYAQRDGGLLYAVHDRGNVFDVMWSRAVSGTPYAGHFAINANNDVIVPDSGRLVMLDHESGRRIGQSVPLVATSTLNPRFAVGTNGTIYVSNGGSADGALFALSPDLDSLWSIAVPNIVYSGPAMSDSGDLVVSGSGNSMLVVQGPRVSTITLFRPADGSLVSRDTIAVAWNRLHHPNYRGRILYRLSYIVYRSDGLVNALGGIPVIDTFRLESAEGLTGSTTLGASVYWSVSAEDSSDNMLGASDGWTFHIPDASAVDNPHPHLPVQFAIVSVSPNPFNSESRVTLSLPAATHLKLSLFDLLGREISVISNGTAAAGVVTIPLDGSRWASGTYFLRAKTTRGESAAQKILLLK